MIGGVAGGGAGPGRRSSRSIRFGPAPLGAAREHVGQPVGLPRVASRATACRETGSARRDAEQLSGTISQLDGDQAASLRRPPGAAPRPQPARTRAAPTRTSSSPFPSYPARAHAKGLRADAKDGDRVPLEESASCIRNW